MICDKCIHNHICCDEGKDEGLTFCADFMEVKIDANDFYNMLKNPITLDALVNAKNKYIVLDILHLL